MFDEFDFLTIRIHHEMDNLELIINSSVIRFRVYSESKSEFLYDIVIVQLERGVRVRNKGSNLFVLPDGEHQDYSLKDVKSIVLQEILETLGYELCGL